MSGTELEERECEKGGRNEAGEREERTREGGERRKRTDRGTRERELEVVEKWRNIDGKRRDKGAEKDRGSNSQ